MYRRNGPKKRLKTHTIICLQVVIPSVQAILHPYQCIYLYTVLCIKNKGAK